MTWLPYLASTVPGIAPWLATGTVSPLSSAGDDIVSYIVGYGPIGVFLLALAWLLYKGWQVISPPRMAAVRDDARADLIAENKRLIDEKHAAEQARDEALRMANDQIVPVLASFNATMSALLPVLQDLVARGEVRASRSRQGR
jgi:hypothetical protein